MTELSGRTTHLHPLPQPRDSSLRGSAAGPQPDGRPTVRLLLVDPDCWSRRSLAAAVAHVPDLSVVDALDSCEQLTPVLASETHVDLILLSLPQLGDAELTLIGRLRELPDPPRVAVFTDGCDHPTVLAARGRGAGGYLVRSDELDLPAALRLVAAGAVLLSPTAAAAADVMLARALALHPPTLNAAEPAIPQRQLDVLQLVAEGRSNPEIGAQLHIEVRTVKWHISKLLEQFRLRDRQQLIAHAYNHGLLSQPLDTERPAAAPSDRQ